MNIDDIKRVGLAAAYRAGEVLRTHFGNLENVQKKGAIDLVTEADIKSEKVIIEIIHNSFPEHSILAEESGLEKGREADLWIIDPLDGTTNFAHRLPVFCVSIAFESKGDLIFGIVLNPESGELFTSAKGEGSKLNGKSISPSKVGQLSESLLVTGFPYDHYQILDSLMNRFARCLTASQGLRRLGSAALDLCYVASGRFEGFWEQNLKPWDTAAGTLIAREAGAVVTDFSGNSFNPYQKEILATNGKIHQEMLSLLEEKV